MKNIIELFIRADAKWENFGKFYISQEYINVSDNFIKDLENLDWIDTIKCIKEKYPLQKYFEILDECYEVSLEGDEAIFNEYEVYDNVELYNDETPEKNFENIKKFYNQGFFMSEDSRIFAYISIYQVDDDTEKKLKSTYICIKDTIRNKLETEKNQ